MNAFFIFKDDWRRNMTSEELREAFVEVLKREFPEIRVKKSTLKSGKVRYSPFVPNHKKNKRWMQLDANPQYLSIAMDHAVGDITMDDLKLLGLGDGLNGSSNAIQLQKDNDAVNSSIFINEPFDFTKDVFITFIHKHYASYLRSVNL